MSEKERNDLCPSGFKPGVLYGLAKIHKALEDGAQSFHPILSTIGTLMMMMMMMMMMMVMNCFCGMVDR